MLCYCVKFKKDYYIYIYDICKSHTCIKTKYLHIQKNMKYFLDLLTFCYNNI